MRVACTSAAGERRPVVRAGGLRVVVAAVSTARLPGGPAGRIRGSGI